MKSNINKIDMNEIKWKSYRNQLDIKYKSTRNV